ncbi:MAG: complex I NDUFA9 subunit family protein [Gammaproteobacteria bacterium]
MCAIMLANRLVNHGYTLRILTRDRERHKQNLILLPGTDLVEADIHDANALTEQIAGCDAVINLVGILNERGGENGSFRHVHVELMEKIIRSCRANGVRRLLQMSALNADAKNAPSRYLRTKGEAEDMAHAARDIRVTSYRPSVIFGDDDSFFNRFADLLKLAPGIFPLACAHARFAPVFVGDIAEVFIHTLKDPDFYGRRLDLCGPHVYTLQELVEYTATCLGLRRKVIPLPDFLSRMQAAMIDMAGFMFNLTGVEKPFSMDNYLSMKVDSVSDANDLPAIVPQPTAPEAVVPQYLAGHTYRSHYDQFRRDHA